MPSMNPRRLSAKTVRDWIVPRKPDSHKGDYGHVLIVAGSRGMTGAPVLSALGALRGGAGLVTVAVPKSQQPVVAAQLPLEAMSLALPETESGSVAPEAVPALLEFLQKRKSTAMALGPGLSRDGKTVIFVKEFLKQLSRNRFQLQAVVLDADGFVALKREDAGDPELKDFKFPVAVTPHPGEMARFLESKGEKRFDPGVSGAKTASREELAQKFAKLNRVVCLLKGHRSLISDGDTLYENSTGNPGMATGGSGDVLTGLIAALVPQMKAPSDLLKLFRATSAAVFVHGLAGDLAAIAKTEIAMTAGDLAQKIPDAFRLVLGNL